MLTAMMWALLGAVSVGAILYGVRRHRPARRAPWLLLAGSLAAISAGDVLYEYDTLPVLADTIYLVMFGLVAMSLVQFTRGGSLLVDRARLIDLIAFACSTMLVVWVYVIGSGSRFRNVSPADVIGDLLLIVVAGRLVTEDRRNVSAILLVTGGVSMLAGDVFFPLSGEAPATEWAFVLLYLAWGASALHPSMARLTEPRPVRLSPWRFRDTVLLAASAATPPLVLVIEAISGTVDDGFVIAVTGAVTLLLTITRLADAVQQNSQALARERALRTANTALVAAVDAPAVEAAVQAAVTHLLPSGSAGRVVLDGAELPAAPAGAGARSWWTGERTLICPLRLEPLAVARPSGGALIITGPREALVAGRDALEVLAGETALALDRITLVEAIGRRDSDLYLRAVTGNTAEIMAVVDSDHRIRYASPGLRRLTGAGELPPLTAFDELIHPDDQAAVRAALRSEGDGKVFCALPRPDGTQVLAEVRYRDLRADRLVQGLVVTLRLVGSRSDVSEPAPHHEHQGELPSWVNRRSAQHKFRY
ncbi:PAS domain-containing protein [Actinoplanes couchii]|uniref:PAS domain-containing protein n=1 Tax=Actinoplanes couchii TaxID=403638 RepID=A0ABQ3XQG5_9ACTN|nr:PAS domain-containing protein [Actinoplanes couchii]MDR6323050.1 PAS domain-containing protein [Actinoplanes couchii]GID60723.1 hypothetical protein Aco03nite_091270 [Actinoplanes couchii]